MVSTLMLWSPILVSAVVVFLLSWIIHVVFTYHRSDFRAVPSEDEVMGALRPFNIPPGDYVIPRAGSPKMMEDPEFKAKVAKGPVAFLTVMTNDFGMTKSLVLWFLYCILIGMFAAYLAGHALEPGAHYLAVFRFVGAASFGGYALALLQNSIWYKRNWGATLKSMMDGFLYALVTAGIFGWLWPA